MAKQAYKSRYNSVKQRKGGQLSLFDTEGMPAVAAVGCGIHVKDAEPGRAEWWLADCAKTKTATQDLMSSITDLSNLLVPRLRSCDSERSAERVFESLISYIENRLRLGVNRARSGIRRGTELNYLGHGILSAGSLQLSKSSEKRLKDKLRERTRRNRGISFGQVIEEIDRLLRGWLSYFRYAKMKSRLQYVESWLKRRLRCYRLKQCKRAIGIYRLLKKLGVPTDRSWTTGSNRRGWWGKALTPAAHEGMNNEWFVEIGLLRITEHYAKLHT